MFGFYGKERESFIILWGVNNFSFIYFRFDVLYVEMGEESVFFFSNLWVFGEIGFCFI